MEYFVLFFPVLVEMDALAAATPTTAEPGAPVVAAAAAEGEGAAGDAAPAPAPVHGPDPGPEQPSPANGLDDDGEPQLQPSWRTPQPRPAPTPPSPSAPTPTLPAPTSGVEFAGQVLRVNANVAVVALTAPCGATRLCALLRGQVRVNGGARAWEAPLPTLLAVGLPVCVRPRPAAQGETEACRWVSDELLLEQCVRAPTRVRCAEITRLAGKDGEVQVVVAGRCASAAFSRKNVVVDGAKLPSGCLLSKSGLEVGWAAAVRLEPVLVAPGGGKGGGEGERPQLRAAELMTTTCAHTRRRLELRLVDGDALADALAAEGAQPLARRARLLRVDDDVVTAALQPELFAVASDDDRPLLVKVLSPRPATDTTNVYALH
ncbi:hypothetical protein R5R35_007305 [Gryllus longicercus]|uniref:Uncharacterized protein n=1 Tax=Gryllus longicercus TaxID=2509291 RepID=A0AAN9VWF5_9ORTH